MKPVLSFFLTLSISLFILPGLTGSAGIELAPQEKIIPFISGKVIDERGFPVPYAKVFISGSEVKTDVTGSFAVSNASSPYDAMIAERNTSTAVMYKDLTVPNPELVMFGEPDTRNYNRVSVKVEFPQTGDTTDVYAGFISREIMQCESKKAASGTNYVFLTIDFPFAVSSVRGDFVMVMKTPSGYEFFRKKSVLVTRGSKKSVVIMPSKPEYRTALSSSKIFSSLKDYYYGKITISLDFTEYSKNSRLTVFETDAKDARILTELPEKLPNTVRLRVEGYAESRSGSKFRTYYYSSTGQDYKIADEFLPELIVPTEGFMGVNGSTEFRYTVGSGAGIYVLEFRCRIPEMRFFVVTRELSGRLSILSRQEFSNTSNLTFSWRVRKYITYFSVDEFVRPNPFKTEIGYKGVLFSNGRSFRTGYF